MPRKAMPIALHLIDGNKNRLTKAEIEARKAAEERLRPKDDKVKPPSWLSKQAKKVFREIVQDLADTKLLTNVDVHTLALWCDAYVDYINCTKIIEQEGLMVEYTNKAAETNKVAHPLMTKKKQLAEQMRALASEFGLTPAARAKLAIPKDPPKEPTPFEREFGNV